MRVLLPTSVLSLISPLVASDKIVLIDRNYYSYGYEGNVTDGAPNGFAFGMGGLEKTSFDSKEKILYGISEQGFITLIDYGNGPVDAPQLPIVITDKDTYTDIHVCSEQGILFASTKDDPNSGYVAIYKAATRSEDTVTEPELMHTIEVGYGPDMLAPNSNCSIVAVANEGEGDYDDAVGLINPEGSVTLIKGPFDDASTQPAVSHVSFPWTDDELLAKGIHLPLSLNAMEYWDDHSSIAGDIDFASARANYTGASVLEPEWLVWSADEKYVLVNLQENSALVKVNVADEVAEDIYSYGLKSWETTPIDVVEDDGCSNMPTVEGLFSVRSPDAIAAINVNGETYIATANEGDDLSYGGFDEKLKSKDIFSGSSLGLVNATADPIIFDPADPMAGQSKYFNADCEDAADGPEWCSDSMRMSIGSEMIDYSNPTNIVVKSMIAIGGRGITIYKLTEDGLDLVWDSASEFEVEGCKAYPWAHNGIQDEEFANVNGTLYMADESIRETLEEMNDPNIDGCADGGDGQPGACALGDTVDERSAKDGYAAEAVKVGQACGKTYLVTISEKNSVGFLYDLTDITSPQLTQVFHLSPESETKNPTVAYDERTLGEIDSESILFLDETESPTGVPSIIFAGAWSSTTSYWEFECDDSVSVTDPTATNGVSTVTATNGDSTSTEEEDSNADADAGTESDGADEEAPIIEEESASDASSAAKSLIAAIFAFMSAATFL